MNHSFDVALSYCADDAWVAKDLHLLVGKRGFAVYAYDFLADRAGGFLRDELAEIYESSCLNVLIWSRSYKEKQRDSLVSMERRVIVGRHVRRGEDKSLVIVTVDTTPLDRDLGDILAHSVLREGVTGTTDLIAERAKKLLVNQKEPGMVVHPPGTFSLRGQLTPCSFSIDSRYRSDRHKRWKKLADVLVDFPNPLETRSVYLIPSGRANSLIRHSHLLREDERLLGWKRMATEEFIRQNSDTELHGFWFKMRLGDIDVATVYCEQYDAFLNLKLNEFIREADW